LYAEAGRDVLMAVAEASITLSGFLLITTIFLMDRQREFRVSISKKDRRVVLIADILVLVVAIFIPFIGGLQISFESVSLLARMPSVGLLQQGDIDGIYNLINNFKIMLYFVVTGLIIWLVVYGSLLPYYTSAGRKKS